MGDVGIQTTAPCWLLDGEIGSNVILVIYRDSNRVVRPLRLDGHSDITRIDQLQSRFSRTPSEIGECTSRTVNILPPAVKVNLLVLAADGFCACRDQGGSRKKGKESEEENEWTHSA